MKKGFFVLIINIILIFLAIWIGEILIYKYQVKIFYNNRPKIFSIDKYTYKVTLPSYLTNLKDYNDGSNNISGGRKPDGIEYKNAMPITIFGCSYAFGQHLNYNQTFSYKLPHKLTRPVYNRAISGGSFQHMYMQATDNSFFEDVPESDIVMYVMIRDHYRRRMLKYFDILNTTINPHYSIKRDKLVIDNYNNKLLNFINSLYIVKSLNRLYAENYTKNNFFANRITDDTLFFFTETRKELQKKWNKDFKFIVILYEDWDIQHKDLLIKKLKQNGFDVISTNELTDEDLTSEKYMMQDNHHPTEAAWDLLTPKIIEKFGLK